MDLAWRGVDVSGFNVDRDGFSGFSVDMDGF